MSLLDQLPGLRLGEFVTETSEHLHQISSMDLTIIILVKYPEQVRLASYTPAIQTSSSEHL